MSLDQYLNNLMMRPFNPRQEYVEFERFVEILQNNDVRSYLEIGSRFGGTLWWVAEAIPKGSLLVSVDNPEDYIGDKLLTQCINEIRHTFKHNVVRISGNSQSEQVVRIVSEHAPFDAIFIDADHSLKGVAADWNNYHSMGRLIGIHDIASTHIPKIEVHKLWSELKKLDSEEIICEGSIKGIGIVYRC